MKAKKGVLAPSSAKGYLDYHNKTAVRDALAGGFQSFVEGYMSPPVKEGDRLDIRYAPDVWLAATSETSRSHLFLATQHLMGQRRELKDWLSAREKGKQVCCEKGDEEGLLRLNQRPKYILKMSASGVRCCFPAWDEEVKDWFLGTAYKAGVTGRVLLVVYSSKVLLDSGLDLKGWRPYLEREWSNWLGWAEGEKDDICRHFSFI